jgi:hypothetical protein
MGECKTSIINPGIVKEWCATKGEFMGMLKPAMPPFSGLDQPEALGKWLVIQAWLGILSAVVGFVMGILSVGSFGIVGLIQGIVIAILGAWLSWFMLVKREPSCCCICIVVIENWKQMHLVYGLLVILQAVFMVFTVIRSFMAILTPVGGVSAPLMVVVYSAISLGMAILYNITWFFIGLSATKIGAKKAGVELPETVGKASDAA